LQRLTILKNAVGEGFEPSRGS